MDQIEAVLLQHPWGLYALFAAGIFVQEDAAVIAGAAAAAAGAGEPALIFAAMLLGFAVSDSWKYWVGRLALTHQWARKIADRPGVRAARDRVVNRLGLSLLAVRFIPGTRIPFYVASGFFRAPFAKYFAFIVLAAACYLCAAFALFFALGEVAGAHARRWLPWVALTMVALVIGWQVWRARKASRAAKAAD